MACAHGGRTGTTSVKVLLVDDHPALRAGLEGLLTHERGFECVGAVSTQRELAAVLSVRRPDVVLLDYALKDGNGLTACFCTKQLRDSPGVVLYSAYVDSLFAVPATLALADAIVPKTAPVAEVLDAVRCVAAGGRRMPPLDADAVEAVTARIAAADLPIAGMLFAGTAVTDIAATLRVEPGDIRARAFRMIRELQARDHVEERSRAASPDGPWA